MNCVGKMTINFRTLLSFLLVAAAFLLVDPARAQSDAPLQLLSPLSEASGEISVRSAQQEQEVYINRRGMVHLDAAEIFRQETTSQARTTAETGSSFKGRRLILSFFNDSEIEVRVNTESRSPQGTVSLNGNQTEGGISTFSMTVTSGTYLITYQDMEKQMTYRVVGDVESGDGRVIEVDLSKMPPVYDVEPLVPPQQ